MGCLIGILAVFMPRIALLVMWIWTPYVSRAFHGGFIWPFLGLILLPFTTIMYSVVWVPGVGVTGWRWAWVVLGVLLDLIWHGGGASKAKKD
ncbi:MAG: hypothetical protein ACYC99_17590 [Candidatus Geothermincolia bacterium]